MSASKRRARFNDLAASFSLVLKGEFSRVVLSNFKPAGSERTGEVEPPVLVLASALLLLDGVGGNSMRDFTLLARAVKRRTRWRT